jgi:hypothetical protein
LNPQKGKDMTTVRFAEYMNSEHKYELLLANECKKGSGFVYSYEVRRRQN